MFQVKVPATSANLGPGYDCAGAALSLYSHFGFERAERLSIEGCPAAYQNEDNLVIQAFRRTLEAAGQAFFPVHLLTRAEIPFSRGLGSSASCIVAGALAANHFVGGRLSEEDLLNICTQMEGHPDNVAPCLYGGIVSGFTEEGRTHIVRFRAHPRWRFVTVIPDYEVSTAKARKVVKNDIDVKTSVYTTGHAIAFLHALEIGDCRLAALACHDLLHEPYRRKLIPDYEGARALALESGAVTFFISGSGSTMIALCDGEQAGQAERVLAALQAAYPQFEVRLLELCAEGAEVEE